MEQMSSAREETWATVGIGANPMAVLLEVELRALGGLGRSLLQLAADHCGVAIPRVPLPARHCLEASPLPDRQMPLALGCFLLGVALSSSEGAGTDEGAIEALAHERLRSSTHGRHLAHDKVGRRPSPSHQALF